MLETPSISHFILRDLSVVCNIEWCKTHAGLPREDIEYKHYNINGEME